MARGDNLQLDVKGEIQLSGPWDGESAARSILAMTLRRLFSDLNDPLVCPRFAATGIADETADQIAQAPWIRYRIIGGPKPGVGEALKRALGLVREPALVPFVAPKAGTRRLAELLKLIKKARGRKRAELEMEARGLAFMIGHARIAYERREQERLEKERTKLEKKIPVKVFVKKLDVKYRNPPNQQWKWWARILDEMNTIQPGTFTPGP
jgi:hypothetical protein